MMVFMSGIDRLLLDTKLVWLMFEITVALLLLVGVNGLILAWS